MPHFKKQLTLPASREALFSWHSHPGAFHRLNPPWNPVSLLEAHKGIQDGNLVKISLPPLGIPWTLQHEGFVENEKFEDHQKRGPFRFWHHQHSFFSSGEGSTMSDEISFALPMALGEQYVLRELSKLFSYRHYVTSHDVLIHEHDKLNKKLHVLITGASGLIGEQLCAFLLGGGHSVTTLGRRDSGIRSQHINWNFDASVPSACATIAPVDAVIHLAGENIAQRRWTDERKHELVRSRVQTSKHLCDLLIAINNTPPVFITASGVGAYGESGEQVISEHLPNGSGFLAELAKEWEHAPNTLQKYGTRIVQARFGVVLSSRGGALKRMKLPFSFGLGASLGSGQQWMSWIGIEDALAALLHIIRNDSLDGACNVCSPEPVRNIDFSRALARALQRPLFARIPRALVTLLFGEMGEKILLESQRAVPQKLLKSGFTFAAPNLEDTLLRTLGRL